MSDDDAMMALLARMGGEKSKKAIKDAGVGAGGKRKAGDAEEGDGRGRPVKKVPKGPGRDEWAAGPEELARMIPSVGAAGGGGGEGGGEDAWVVWNERVRVPSEVGSPTPRTQPRASETASASLERVRRRRLGTSRPGGSGAEAG